MKGSSDVVLLARVLHRLAKPQGFSAPEAATMLAAFSMMTSLAGPAVDDYVAQARSARAMNDVRVLAMAILRMSDDVAVQARAEEGWATSVMLVGPGEVPMLGPGGDPGWTLPAGGTAPSRVALLTDQLVTNRAGYAPRAEGATGSSTGWRGPYIDGPIRSDPWNHRLAANTRWLRTGPFDTVVLSAGSNGAVETPFRQDGLIAGGDDVVAMVSSGR